MQKLNILIAVIAPLLVMGCELFRNLIADPEPLGNCQPGLVRCQGDTIEVCSPFERWEPQAYCGERVPAMRCCPVRENEATCKKGCV